MIRYLSKERENLDDTGPISTRNQDQRKIQKLEERRRAIILFIIVIAFLFLHSLRGILNLEERFRYEEKSKTLQTAKKIGKMCRGDQFWILIAGDYSHLLLQLNAGIHFFVYGFFSKQFRLVAKAKLLYVAQKICISENN